MLFTVAERAQTIPPREAGAGRGLVSPPRTGADPGCPHVRRRLAGHRSHSAHAGPVRRTSSSKHPMKGLASCLGEIGLDDMRERGVRLRRRTASRAELLRPGSRFAVLCRRRSWHYTPPPDRGALLFYSCPCRSVGASRAFRRWPDGVAVTDTGMDNDPISSARATSKPPAIHGGGGGRGAFPVAPGDQRCFPDIALPSYDADATALLNIRVLQFLKSHLIHAEVFTFSSSPKVIRNRTAARWHDLPSCEVVVWREVKVQAVAARS